MTRCEVMSAYRKEAIGENIRTGTLAPDVSWRGGCGVKRGRCLAIKARERVRVWVFNVLFLNSAVKGIDC